MNEDRLQSIRWKTPNGKFSKWHLENAGALIGDVLDQETKQYFFERDTACSIRVRGKELERGTFENVDCLNCIKEVMRLARLIAKRKRAGNE